MTEFSRRGFMKTVALGSVAVSLPIAGEVLLPAVASAATALSASVNTSGAWQVSASDFGWTFGGSVGAATGIATSTGTDNLGPYTDTTFTFQAGSNTVRATATGSNGANIDYLGITKGSVSSTPTQTASFTPASIGINRQSYVYDYFAGTGALVAGGSAVSATVTTGTFWIVAPVGTSGIAFLGDVGKFVSTGDKRIRNLSDDGAVHATIDFAAGEDPVTVFGYAPAKPTASASAGSVGAVSYNTSTKRFTVAVTASSSNQATVSITP